MDNINEFFQAYRENVRQVSAKTLIQDVDEQLLNADICWMVTDNMRTLLAIDHEETNLGMINNVTRLIPYLINDEHLLIFLQNTIPEGHDHWFAIISSQGIIYMIEHLEQECNSVSQWNLNSLLHYLNAMMTGQAPDRFYHEVGEHQLVGWAHHRRAANRSTIMNMLQ